jgi:hypothetical protein
MHCHKKLTTGLKCKRMCTGKSKYCWQHMTKSRTLRGRGKGNARCTSRNGKKINSCKTIDSFYENCNTYKSGEYSDIVACVPKAGDLFCSEQTNKPKLRKNTNYVCKKHVLLKTKSRKNIEIDVIIPPKSIFDKGTLRNKTAHNFEPSYEYKEEIKALNNLNTGLTFKRIELEKHNRINPLIILTSVGGDILNPAFFEKDYFKEVAKIDPNVKILILYYAENLDVIDIFPKDTKIFARLGYSSYEKKIIGGIANAHNIDKLIRYYENLKI